MLPDIILADIEVLTCNPLSGDIDAVADPEPICYKFNPTIPVAGTFVKELPSPINDPLNEPDSCKSVRNCLLSNNLPITQCSIFH